MKIHYEAVSIPDGYLLAAAVVCFILAAAGIALLVWLFNGKLHP